MGQAESSPPIVEVQYDKLTYRELQKEQNRALMGINRSTPGGPLKRIGADVMGAVVLYSLTFVVCDFLKAMQTGRFTHLYWAILGPWNYVTGAPLLHRITHIFDSRGNRQLEHCEKKYSAALKKCDAEYVLGGFGEGGQCHANATAAYQQCYEDSNECQVCVESHTASAGGEYCYRDPYVEGGQVCVPLTPPSQQEIEIECLGELGYDPQ